MAEVTLSDIRAPQYILAYPESYSNNIGEDVWIRVREGELSNSNLIESLTIIDLRKNDSRKIDLNKVVEIQCAPEIVGNGKEVVYESRLKIPNELLKESEYELLLHNSKKQKSHPIHFIVRSLEEHREVGIMHATFTWQAYNRENGGSFYWGKDFDDGKVTISLNRPMVNLSSHHSINSVTPFIDSLVNGGRSFKSFCNLDLHNSPEVLDSIDVLIIVGHDEYWSHQMRDAVVSFVTLGGCIGNFSANVCWWAINVNGNDLYVNKTHQDDTDEFVRGTGQFKNSWIDTPCQEIFGLSYQYAGYPVKRNKFEKISEMISKEDYDNSGDIIVMNSKHPIFNGLEWEKGQRWGGDLGILAVELDGLFLDSKQKIARFRMNKVPRRTKPLAKALVEIAHWHMDDDGKMTSGKKFEEVAIICETRPTKTNLIESTFAKCGIVISCGSIGWFNSLNESHTGKIIFLNSVNYLVEISNNLKKGDLMAKKEEVDGYDDVHNWAMRHGASNNDGRISKSFFPTDKKSRAMADELRPWKLNKVDNGISIFKSDTNDLVIDSTDSEGKIHTTLSIPINLDSEKENCEILFECVAEMKEGKNAVYMIIAELYDEKGNLLDKQNSKMNLDGIGEEKDFRAKFNLENDTKIKTVNLILYSNKDQKAMTVFKKSTISLDDIIIGDKSALGSAFKWPGTTDMSWLNDKRLYIIAGCELSYFSEYLKQSGMKIHHTFENHSAMDPFTELNDPLSMLWEYNPDYIILSQIQIIRTLITKHERSRGNWSKEEQMEALDSVISALEWSIKKIRKDITGPIWLMTHIGTHTPAHGMHEYRGVDNSMGIYELMLNYKLKLYDLARKFSSTYIIDVDLALESTGKWPEGKSPMIRPYETLGGHPESLGAQVLAEYFHHQLLITSKNSRRVKCVVLDCDNTLWKGIIREDGIDGIKIFRTRLQRLWQLSQRGMMMALCSKNDPEDEELIMEALRSYGKFHESIVATRINWTHKSANIRSIAEELNIGLDSLAFFDDNPFERSEVETVLPEVMVYEELEIEQAPDWYNFHPVGDLSKDSADRAQKYKEESVRKEEQQDFGEDNFEDFLVSCGLRIELRSATPAELPRVAELLQRTNQMNATLQRSDLADIRSKYDSGSGFVHIAKLGDKFGDYGLIGVIISELKDKELSIQELAFSCRAMGRRVEHALIEEVIGYASDNKLDKLSINVTKTSRNHQIIKTLDEEGFVEEVVDGDLVTMSTKIKGRKGREIPHWFTISTDIGGDE